jgi:hypothetical protein
VLQLSYDLTQTRVFSMEFPEPFKLSPGMVYSLKVNAIGTAMAMPPNPV